MHQNIINKQIVHSIGMLCTWWRVR